MLSGGRNGRIPTQNHVSKADTIGECSSGSSIQKAAVPRVRYCNYLEACSLALLGYKGKPPSESNHEAHVHSSRRCSLAFKATNLQLSFFSSSSLAN